MLTEVFYTYYRGFEEIFGGLKVQFGDKMAVIEQICGMSCLRHVLPAEVTHKPIIMIYTIGDGSQGMLESFQSFKI